MEASKKQLEENRKSLQGEMGTELLSQLSDKEQSELVKLNEEVAQIKTKIIEISTKRTQVYHFYVGILTHPSLKVKRQVWKTVSKTISKRDFKKSVLNLTCKERKNKV